MERVGDGEDGEVGVGKMKRDWEDGEGWGLGGWRGLGMGRMERVKDGENEEGLGGWRGMEMGRMERVGDGEDGEVGVGKMERDCEDGEALPRGNPRPENSSNQKGV
ncbi:hypothetical protein KOW79_019223 [Hemibagrus wyckioides]|uniref:Uncharacterized protein n=1 Tax=Hemibagrus wyckioides TaxID=337641 RepID=A0A9D3SAZ1_9TELE|nr:hypothetical protein KOW79_019223 [Hemibagrus wyckioides]